MRKELCGGLALLLSLAPTGAEAETVEVLIGDFFFEPEHSQVQNGDTVQWMWVGASNHSTTAAAGQTEFWDSGVQSTGTFDHLFSNDGIFNFYCMPHGNDLGGGQVSGMSGSVTVVAPSGVVINEVLADPGVLAGDANCDNTTSMVDDVFVEIVNTTMADVDLSGASLLTNAGTQHEFPAGTVLAPEEGLVVFGGGTPQLDGSSANPASWCTAPDPGLIVQTASTGLLNIDPTGDRVTLLDAGGTLLDHAGIGTAPVGVSTNRSTELTHQVDMVDHDTLAGAVELFSPGTLVDQTPHPASAQPFVVLFPVPGTAGQVNAFDVVGATPNSGVVLVFGTQGGSTAIPPCAGQFMDINGPRVLGNNATNGAGEVTFNQFMPLAASGRTVFFQAIDVATCEVSPRLDVFFP